MREMIRNGGFFPSDPEHLARFARLSLEDCLEADLLGAWTNYDAELPVNLKASRVPLMDLEPYFHSDPWTQALQGKRVLVVHPFEKTIQRQYARRTELFKDPRILVDFTLLTFPAVQSLGGQCPAFKDWFAALDWMEKGIAALEFDVAIIGAGAYGLSLAAYIKRDLGKKAIHLGGATQVLFGIKGRRYDVRPEYATELYNDAWVRPASDEVPASASQVEGGCYW